MLGEYFLESPHPFLRKESPRKLCRESAREEAEGRDSFPVKKQQARDPEGRNNTLRPRLRQCSVVAVYSTKSEKGNRGKR